MAETLGDDFLNGTKGHFYNTRNSTEILKITEFGSQCCVAEVYDSEGKLLINRYLIHTEEHQQHHRIPDEQLPESLRPGKESPLAQPTPRPNAAENRRNAMDGED